MSKVISGRTDIGPLWSNVPDALKRAVRIDPSAYARLSYNYTGGSSDNWDEVAAALDLLNLRLGNPTVGTLANIVDFLHTKIADLRFMQKEFGSRVYLELHFQPAVLQYVEMRRRGETQIANGLRDWLRALGGYLAWTGCWGPGKVPTKINSKRGPGARLLVGNGDINQRTGGGPECIFSGKRSWHFEGDWTVNMFAPVIMSDLCFGKRLNKGDIAKSHKRFMDAIEAEYGPLSIFNDTERDYMRRATENDIDALEWCRVHLIGDYLPAERNTFIRTTGGVGQVLHEASKSPTAPTYYSGWDADGTTYAAGADNGGRGGHGEQIEDGKAVIDLATRTGWCQRTSGPDRIVVDFALPPGDMVAMWVAQHGRPSVVTYYSGGKPVAPPAPGVPAAPGLPREPSATGRGMWAKLRDLVRSWLS